MTAAVGTFDGTLTTIRAHETRADGTPNPTYRCLFPEPPPPGTVPACAEAGILGAIAGVLGSLMALEVIREIVGFGEGLVGRLLMVDARSMRFETLRYCWDPANPLSGEQPTIRDLSCTPESAVVLAAMTAGKPRRHFDQVATALVPAMTDHLLCAVGAHAEAVGLASPSRCVQKPSCESFQVPSLLAPALPTGSRVIVPSAVNTILNLTLDGVDAVNGWPLKNVVWMSFGASRPAGAAKTEPGAERGGRSARNRDARIDVSGCPKRVALRATIHDFGCTAR